MASYPPIFVANEFLRCIILEMNSDFVLDNKNYISAKRACGIYGYSSNYLAELCDSCVIDKHFKEGDLFVCEDSLKAHKLSLLSAGRQKRIKVDLEPLSGKVVPIRTHLDHRIRVIVFSSIAFLTFFVLFIILLKVIPAHALGLQG